MGENNEVEKALDRYRKAAEKDKELQKYKNQAVKGTADLATAQNYSRRAGEISSDVLEDVLQGVEDEATRKQVISAVLKENYQNVIANTKAVQKSVNESAGVGLNPILADYDAGVADEISDSISRYEDVEAGISAVVNDIVVQSQKYTDISMRKNAEFQSNSGMEVLVTREYDDVGVHTTDKGGGEVCQWCLSRCGTDVPYDEAYQRGMFERHPGCGCVITYKTKKGAFRQGRGDWGTNNWHTVREKKEREKRIISNEAYTQNYKPVIRGKSAEFSLLSGRNIVATKVEGYSDNMYVSEKVTIKPKALHNISKATAMAVKTFNIAEQSRPDIIVVNDEEIAYALACYNAVKNAIFYSPTVGDRAKAKIFQQGMAQSNDMYSTPFHEMWHCKQAMEYEKKHGKITKENYKEYLAVLKAECKAKIDRLGITEENVSEISKYASDMYFAENYDEVEAEYNTLKALKG